MLFELYNLNYIGCAKNQIGWKKVSSMLKKHEYYFSHPMDFYCAQFFPKIPLSGLLVPNSIVSIFQIYPDFKLRNGPFPELFQF